MADYHFNVTQIKRSAGQSAITSAAYRAGEKLHSEFYGEDSDYTHKNGVVMTDILLPSHVPGVQGGVQQLQGSRRAKGKVGMGAGKDAVLPLPPALSEKGMLAGGTDAAAVGQKQEGKGKARVAR